MSALADVNGNVIEVGDWLTWAAQRGDSTVLRFGRVWKINPSSVSLITHGAWDAEESRASLNQPESKALVIDKMTVPNEYRDMIQVAYDARRSKEVPQATENVRRPQRKGQSRKQA